jgi:hypothetical protein
MELNPDLFALEPGFASIYQADISCPHLPDSAVGLTWNPYKALILAMTGLMPLSARGIEGNRQRLLFGSKTSFPVCR